MGYSTQFIQDALHQIEEGNKGREALAAVVKSMGAEKVLEVITDSVGTNGKDLKLNGNASATIQAVTGAATKKVTAAPSAPPTKTAKAKAPPAKAAKAGKAAAAVRRGNQRKSTGKDGVEFPNLAWAVRLILKEAGHSMSPEQIFTELEERNWLPPKAKDQRKAVMVGISVSVSKGDLVRDPNKAETHYNVAKGIDIPEFTSEEAPAKKSVVRVKRGKSAARTSKKK